MIEPTLFGDLRPPDDPPKNSAAPRVAPGAAQQLERTTQHDSANIDDHRYDARQVAAIPLRALSRRGGPPTSRRAAASIEHVAGTRRQVVYDLIVAAGADGLTDDEGESHLEWKSQQWTPRRHELLRLGLIRDSGRRRRTSSGRTAIVWIAVKGVPVDD